MAARHRTKRWRSTGPFGRPPRSTRRRLRRRARSTRRDVTGQVSTTDRAADRRDAAREPHATRPSSRLGALHRARTGRSSRSCGGGLADRGCRAGTVARRADAPGRRDDPWRQVYDVADSDDRQHRRRTGRHRPVRRCRRQERHRSTTPRARTCQAQTAASGTGSPRSRRTRRTPRSSRWPPTRATSSSIAATSTPPRPMWTFRGHRGAITSAVFSEDGEQPGDGRRGRHRADLAAARAGTSSGTSRTGSWLPGTRRTAPTCSAITAGGYVTRERADRRHQAAVRVEVRHGSSAWTRRRTASAPSSWTTTATVRTRCRLRKTGEDGRSTRRRRVICSCGRAGTRTPARTRSWPATTTACSSPGTPTPAR